MSPGAAAGRFGGCGYLKFDFTKAEISYISFGQKYSDQRRLTTELGD